MEMIEVLIADDKQKFRDVLRGLLKAFPIHIIAEAENGLQLLNLLKSRKPDVVLLDLEMPVMDGNKTFEFIRINYPDLKVIILTMFYEFEVMEDFIERGAKGFIPKEYLNEIDLATILKNIKNGGTYVYEKPENQLKLKEKQKILMPMILDNYTNVEMAKEMNISLRAVEKKRKGLYEKMGTDNIIDFLKFVLPRGFQFMSVKGKKK